MQISSVLSVFCLPRTAAAPFTWSSRLQSPQFLYATQNVLDGAPKVAPMSFNNRGEDRIALIYCLIKIQPLPSP